MCTGVKCITITVYGWLSQLRWVEYRLVHKFPWEGYDWWVGSHITFFQDSGVAGRHRSPVRVLETHDDGERDGLAWTGLSGCWRNRNSGDDGLKVIGGVERGWNIWRDWYPRVTGERAMRILERFRERNLGRKEKRDKLLLILIRWIRCVSISQQLGNQLSSFVSKRPAQLCDYRSTYRYCQAKTMQTASWALESDRDNL